MAFVSVLLNDPDSFDHTPPVLVCPEALNVQCTGPEGAVVDFSAAAEDNCDPQPAVAYDHPPGSAFPVGTTLVACAATDAAGNPTQCSFEVEVRCSGQLSGECNQDETVDLSDAICMLGFLFLGHPAALPCGGGTSVDPGNRELLNWNGDAELDLSDAVGLLNWLFQGGSAHVLGQNCRPIAGCAALCGGAH